MSLGVAMGVSVGVRAVFLLVGGLVPLAASAQTRICSYATEEWASDVAEIEAQLAAGNPKEAKILEEVLSRDWECLSEPAPIGPLVRYMQIRALLAFSAQDPEGSLQWHRAAEFALPGAEWPEWVPEFHPIRGQLDMEGPAEVVTIEGKHLAPPKKGGIWIAGRLATTPTAPLETPVFVQAFDKDAARVVSYWQEGAMFPPSLLSDTATAVVAPKWWVPPATPAVVAVATSTEPEPEPVAEPEPSFEPAIEVLASLPPAAAEVAPAAPEPSFEPAIEVLTSLPPAPAETGPATEPVANPGLEAIAAAAAEPVAAEAIVEPAVAAEPEAVAAAQPVATESVEVPVVAIVAEPVVEPIAEPVVEPVAEPIAVAEPVTAIEADAVALVEPVAVPSPALTVAPAPIDPVPLGEPLPTKPMPSPVRTTLRNGGLIAAGAGAALYATSWGLRAAYDGNPTDGLYRATNGTFVASIAAGAAAGGLLVGSFVVSDGALFPRRRP